jgi:hypothetical protein
VKNLNGLVVTALARASEPSLQGCQLVFGDSTDPITQQPINLSFKASDFSRVEEGFGLFTIAARTEMKKNPSEALKLSLKYQVLSDKTAFVGVVKQKDKATGKMVDYSIEFGKSVHSI